MEVKWRVTLLVILWMSLLCAVHTGNFYETVVKKENLFQGKRDHTHDTVKHPRHISKATAERLHNIYGGIGPVLYTPELHPSSQDSISKRHKNEHARHRRQIKEVNTHNFFEFVRSQNNTPEQIHISYGASPSEMIVMWSTALNGTSQVHYGNTPNNLNMQANGRCEKFTLLNPDGLQYLHRVILKYLVPGQKYYYYVQTGSDKSEVVPFSTMKNGTDWTPTFYVFGDMGKYGGAPSLKILNEAAINRSVDVIIHVGDFAYDLHSKGGKVGDDFMNRLQYCASRIPYMTSVGNHEIAESTFSHYRYRFSMPSLPWPTPIDDMWYSFNMGKVHFVCYSTEVYFTNNPTAVENQLTWLKMDLQKANLYRDIRPWVIVFGHRPMYCSNLSIDDCTKRHSVVRAALESLFYDFGVDLIIQAHEHSYERFWPMYQGKVVQRNYTNPGAPVHFIGGAAGCNEIDGICVSPMLGPRGPWSAFRAWLPGLYGIGKVTVANETHLHWQQVIAKDEKTMDQVWIEQNYHGPFPHPL